MITQVVAMDTVMIVQWPPEFRIGLVGVGVCELPSVDIPKKFARVEVGFKATLDPGAGAFRLEAQISPDSFIFDPNCHLRGGMALCVWWAPSNGSADDLSGDWVFTLGGYHKSFKIPEHYPRPERLAIEWKCDDHVSIRGEAYFAITPKVMMAGGMLSITMSCGNLSAWFNAWLDLLINYHPFKFVADGGVTIGVSYTLDLLFVSTNIKVQIGATLHIEGPPVRGVVHVDFWVFGFSIDFGSDDEPEHKAVNLEKFYNLVMAAGTNAQKQDQSRGKTIQDSCHTFNAQSGLLPSSSSDTPAPAAPWSVRSGTFVFSIGCQFPISGLCVGDTNVAVANEAPLYGKPMKSTNEISSQLDVRVFKKKARLADGSLGPYDKVDWKVKTSKKGLPKALWEQYNPDQDPDLKGNQVGSLLDGSKPSTQLTTGVVSTPPIPEISDDNLLPISATELQKEEAFSADDPLAPHFPPLEQAQPQFAPATLDLSAGHYDVVAATWSKPRPQAQSLVDFWAESMLWDFEALSKEDMAVCAEPPAMYIGKRESLWMRAPSLAVGG
ncbi:hypothetical protein B0T22DRAFT_66286 [Podospora appendiculata]|uniref:DUF6603 domain-containing protein n=1 Tax=Podospora appendiculata TaxID=314037 RepID=A0AAE1CGZ7_9PEZI|nr:hypothetical protein B0T22DRAFT_66286 [Podospora appendiculata]